MTDAAETASRIRCLTLFVADYVAVERGKLYVSGGYWNHLRVKSFPTALNLGVGAVFEIPWHNNSQHQFVISFESEDGKAVGGTLTGVFKTGTPPDAREGDPNLLPIAANLNRLVIPEQGDYSVIVSIDGNELDRWGFRVTQTVSIPGSPNTPGDGQ